MYKLDPLDNNGQNQDVSQCNNTDVFTGHNMNNTTSCSLNSTPPESAPKSTTSVLRRWRRPEPHDSGTKHVQAKDVPPQPSKYVNSTPGPDADKQMNQVGSYVSSAEPAAQNTGSDYSMFVPQLSPLVPQSTARPYDSKYLPHVQYGDNAPYSRTSPAVPVPQKVPDKNGTASYYHQDGTNQEVHFRSPSYPVQCTPPLAHSASQKCVLPNENTSYQNRQPNPHRDYSVVAHNYSPPKLNPTETKEDPSYCLSKGYVQDNRISPQNITPSYPIQSTMDRRVSPHNSKSPIYRNFPNSDSRINIPQQNFVPTTKNAEYIAQNTNYYMEKSPCITQKPSQSVIDTRYVQNYNQNYYMSKTAVTNQDPKLGRDYRSVVTNNSKKSSPPFPILEQRLNQPEANYCAEYSAQAYYPSKYGSVMYSRTSPTPKIVRDGSVTAHNYPGHHNPKIPPQEVMIPSNYSFPNKYYQQTQGYEQNLYLSQMNQMHARLPHNKNADTPRDLSYVDPNQRLVQKTRMYCPESSPVELHYPSKSVIPQKSPKMVSYNLPEQRPAENVPHDYLNLSRSCGTIKTTDYQRSPKVGEYSPVIQSVKAAERDYLMHPPACRNELPNDQQNYACSPPLLAQSSRNPPPYPVQYPRQQNIKMNEMPARNISPRRTFQENMPVVVFSPQHIGLPKSSPTPMYPPEYPNPQHYPGYYARDAVYSGGAKPGIPQYPIDQSKYPNVNRNIAQQRFYGYPEHQYYQHKHTESSITYQANIYRAHYNPNLAEYFQQNAGRAFETDYRNAAASHYDFEASRVDDRAVYSKKESDIGKSLKEFLESWEDDEEIVANLPDLVLCNNIPPDKQKLAFGFEEASEASKSSSDEDSPKEPEQPLYILETTKISSEALPQYLAVYEQVDRLPDNIKYFKDASGAEEPQPVVKKEEKQSDRLDVPEVPNIRESLSPHDLTVNKSRNQEKTDTEEEVLNLSTNRNKENDEFLVEEYSNASDVSENQEITAKLESQKSETEGTKTVEEYKHEDVLKETKEDDNNKENVNNIVVEQVKEASSDDDLQEVGESLRNNEKCIALVPLEKQSPNKNDSLDKSLEIDRSSDEAKNEEQPKFELENISEKSLTTSVIVPNKYFDNGAQNNKIETLAQTENSVKENDCKKSAEITEIASEITPQICEDIITAEYLEDQEKSEEIEMNTLNVLKDIDPNETSSKYEENKDKLNNNLNLGVFDFDIPSTDTKTESIEDKKLEKNKIINEPEEIEPISFENLINSPENIEMKDDDSISNDFSSQANSLKKKLQDIKSPCKEKDTVLINSSPCTPKNIDLSLSENEPVAEIELETVTDNNEEIETTSERIETEKIEKDPLLITESEFETIVPEEPNEILVDNIEKIVEEQSKDTVKPEPLKDDVKVSLQSEETNVPEIKSENLEEDKKEDPYTTLPNLSPIPGYIFKDNSVEIEDYTEDLEEKSMDQQVTENIIEPAVTVKQEEIEEHALEYTDIHVKKEIDEHNQEIIEPLTHFESTVDKLIISNVESIQDDSNDSIIQEKSTEEISEEVAVEEEVQIETHIPDDVDEYAHLIDIEKNIEKEASSPSPIIRSESIVEASVQENSAKNDDSNNFDFSYLESCTDNICEKPEGKIENVADTILVKNNLKSLLESSESDSDIAKENETYVTVNKAQMETEDHSVTSVSNQEKYLTKVIQADHERIVSEKTNSNDLEPTNELQESEKDSDKVPGISEAEVHDVVQEGNDEISVFDTTEICETEIITSDPIISKVEQPESEKPCETLEIIPEVPENTEISGSSTETITETVPLKAVENMELASDSVILAENVSSEENIILPEDSQCVVIYDEDEQYLIIQPDSETAEIIPSEELVSEILIPDEATETEAQKEDIFVEQIGQVTEEPICEEIIICEEGIEDWVQNEEIIGSSGDETDSKEEEIDSKNEEIDSKKEEINLKNKEIYSKNKIKAQKVEEKEYNVAVVSPHKNIENVVSKNKQKSKKTLVLAEKREKKLDKQEKQKHVSTKEITETFINEEKKYSFPQIDLQSSVEEKELFINPENPLTAESMYHFLESNSVIKRRVSYGDSSPKIDFKAPKRRYSTMDTGRSVKKPIINLEEISKNITEVLENLTKQETKPFVDRIEPELKGEVEKEKKIKEKIKFHIDYEPTEKKYKQEIKEDTIIDNIIEKELPIQPENKVETKQPETKTPKADKPINNSPKESNNSNNTSSDNVTKLVEQLIKPKLVIQKTNYNFVQNNAAEKKPEPGAPVPNRRPSLPKTPDKISKVFDDSLPIINTARLTEPIFLKTSTSDSKTVSPKRANVDPRIERPKDVPEKEEKQSLIENKLSNTFGLTEYTKNFIKMKTGQTVDPKNLCGLNGTKKVDPLLTKPPVKISNTRRKHLSTEEDNKNNEKKVKINLQDYRNRKQSSSQSGDSISSSENSMSSPQIDDVKKDSEDNIEVDKKSKIKITKVEKKDSIETKSPTEKNTSVERKISVEQKNSVVRKDSNERKNSVDSQELNETKEEIPDRKVEKLIIKPKKALEHPKDSLLIPEVTTTNQEEPKTNNTNKLDYNNLDTGNTVNSKSKVDLKQIRPKKRKRRFRNLYAVDEEDEVPTKQNKNSLDAVETKLNCLLNDDSTSSSRISEDGCAIHQNSESLAPRGEFLCCLDLDDTPENGYKCHIKEVSDQIRDYEINKNSCTNKLKLTLKPVKKKKPAFSEVLSNLDSLVESEILSKRHRKNTGKSAKSDGDGTHWTIKNKVPKVIIKRNGSGYCAVFRDVSSNPIWQPKIRLKRQKYIESLVLRDNVKC